MEVNVSNPPNSESTIDPSNDNSVEHDIPLVLQCSRCLSIVGDSLAWVCACHELKMITLRQVTDKVIQTKGLLTSTHGYDIGSTYLVITCDKCKGVLGKMYKTTPRHLDELREYYSFDVDQIESYQVGSPNGPEGDKDNKDLTMPSVKTLFKELRKVQAMIVTLNSRIEAIENCMEVEEEEKR